MRLQASNNIGCVLVFLSALLCSAALSPCQSTPASAEDSDVQGRRMLDQAIAALGGAAYLSVSDITLNGRFYQIYHGSTSGAAVFVDYLKYPDKERREIGKKKENIIINNGNRAWEVDFKGVHPWDEEQVQGYLRDQAYSLDRFLRFEIKTKKYRIYYDGVDLVQTTRYDIITFEDANRERISILLNATTHLPEALRYRVVSPKTQGVDRMESWYGNFQKVQGIMTPFHRERTRNGERISETFINEVRYNTGLSDALFVPPGKN
jgi:outer membrane lipoprotein-sorting protein